MSTQCAREMSRDVFTGAAHGNVFSFHFLIYFVKLCGFSLVIIFTAAAAGGGAAAVHEAPMAAVLIEKKRQQEKSLVTNTNNNNNNNNNGAPGEQVNSKVEKSKSQHTSEMHLADNKSTLTHSLLPSRYEGTNLNGSTAIGDISISDTRFTGASGIKYPKSGNCNNFIDATDAHEVIQLQRFY